MGQMKRRALLSVAFPTISRSLNEASDNLTAQILEFEEALAKFRLGVSAEIVLHRDDVESDEPMTYVESVEYGKHKGRWALWQVSYYEESVDVNDPNSYTVVPLKDAPREFRFEAVEKFQELLQKLAEEDRNSLLRLLVKPSG